MKLHWYCLCLSSLKVMRDVCQFVLTLTAASVPSGQVQVVGGLQSPQGPFRPLPRKSPRLQVGKINREGRGQNMHFLHHVFIGRNTDLTFLLCDRGSISTSASCWTNSCSTRVPVGQCDHLNHYRQLEHLKHFHQHHRQHYQLDYLNIFNMDSSSST